MDWLWPVAGTLGLGGLLGWAAGNFVRTTARLIGCLLGLVFILMQILAYYGIAEWHWEILQKAVVPAQQAAKAGGSLLWKIMTYNLPFAGGFATGFWLGVRR